MRTKKLIILYAAVLFLIVFAVTLNCVCSIARFDVTFEVGSMQSEALAVQERLEEEYGGKSYLFFTEEDAAAIVAEEGEGYFVMENFSKSFPNVIRLRVREKLEKFSFVLGGRYYAVDKDGTVLAVKDSADNNTGGSNIAVYGISFAEAKEGETLTVAAEDAAAYAAVCAAYEAMEEVLGDPRGNVVSVTYDRDSENMDIRMAEGVLVRIHGSLTDTKDRVAIAMRAYTGEDTALSGAEMRLLTDAERTHGCIHMWAGDDVANYSADVVSSSEQGA